MGKEELSALRADFFWQDKQDLRDHYLVLTILLILSEKGNSYTIKLIFIDFEENEAAFATVRTKLEISCWDSYT